MQLYDDEVFECDIHVTLYLVDDIKCFQNVQVFAELYVSMTRTFHCCLNFSALRRAEWTSLLIRVSIHHRCITGTRLCVHCPFYESIKNQTVVLRYLNLYVQVFLLLKKKNGICMFMYKLLTYYISQGIGGEGEFG